MSWSIEFMPFVPWSVLWALAALGAVLLALLFWRSSRGAIFRLLSYALLLLAIANPQLKQEDREPLSDVVAVVLDDSQSQTIAGRTARTDEIRKQLEERLKAFPNLDVRWVHSTSTSADSERDGTMLFSDLAQALADVPPDRLAGVIMVTDGEVHDVPASAAGLGFDAPVQALLTGKPGEFDRRLQVLSAPRFGIVGSAQDIEVKVTDTTTAHSAEPVQLTITHQGQPPIMRNVRVGETVEIPVNIAHAGANIVEIEAQAAPGELTTVNNRAVLTVEGVRENLRVLLVSGEPHAGERTWRNMLKSDASVDLVHFTILRPPEKQDGTPINQLVADRLPDPRAVPGEARSIRPDHLRPLPAPRRASLALSRECRPLRGKRRRRAGLGRRRLCLAAQPLPHAARPDPSRRALRAAWSRSRSSPSSPSSARSTP